MYKQRCVQALFPEHLKNCFYQVVKDYSAIREIRIRRNSPIQILKENRCFYIDEKGNFTMTPGNAIILNEQAFMELFNHICRHSVYAFEQELCKGYLTVEGGHRIGVVGQTVWDGHVIKSLKYISAINIRIAHEIKGVADEILPYLYEKKELKSTLLISPPGCGKTTLLRDLIRKISNGSRHYEAKMVSLIDERSEIASCYLGMAQNDVGLHTDILDACPKAVGMLMVLRSMSPQVIAVDELGGEEDYAAMQQAFYLGCKMLATIHGTDYATLQSNPLLKKVLVKGGFERLVFLQGKAGETQKIMICNERGEVLHT